MHGANVDREVAFLREATSAARYRTGEYFSILQTDVSVSNLKVTSQFSRCGADDRTLRTLWWMRRLDVSL